MSRRGKQRCTTLLLAALCCSCAQASCLDGAYASLARAQVAAAAGNQARAHQYLASAQQCTRQLGTRYKAAQRGLSRLEHQSWVQPADLQSGLSLVASAEAQASAQHLPGALGLSAALGLGLASAWAGAHILAALLALAALWLMWRAFGQGKRFKAQRGRGLWVGLLLLVAPIVAQGVLALLGTLGTAVRSRPLQLLGSLASGVWWPLEALCVVAGLGMITTQLYHICRQFGIFGTVRRPTLTPLENQSGWDLE